MKRVRFFDFVLRTTDTAAARAFYRRVFDGADIPAVDLPEPARARGARPHWLGHLDVGSGGGLDAALPTWAANGAARLGVPTESGAIVLRGPGGGIVALSETRTPTCRLTAGWHLLHTREYDASIEGYVKLCGWALTEREDLGALGVFQRFAWSAGEPSAGAVTDVRMRPAVHPHWLHFFVVASLDHAVAAARTHGGAAVGPTLLPSGVRMAVCDDPHGAAFGLVGAADVPRIAAPHA